MAILGLMMGGALGTLLRYSITLWLQGTLSGGPHAGFPLGTLVVNVLGSFLLALIVGLGLKDVVAPEVRLAVGTGFLGAFTTFSTFELETDNLMRERRWGWVAAYLLGNLVLGYGGLLGGRALAARLAGS